ncbi:MAG TPA: hypothetical protein VL098_12635 [Flavipsychrobacter sp.]|nr:hypothetical protein [Flavipsychrobacter sp.]
MKKQQLITIGIVAAIAAALYFLFRKKTATAVQPKTAVGSGTGIAVTDQGGSGAYAGSTTAPVTGTPAIIDNSVITVPQTGGVIPPVPVSPGPVAPVITGNDPGAGIAVSGPIAGPSIVAKKAGVKQIMGNAGTMGGALQIVGSTL